MYCVNCGNKCNEGEKYCTYCGSPLEIEESSNNTKTDSSLITGILACLFFSVPIISIPLAVISIIMGANYKKESGKTSAGLILGIISLILSVLITIVVICFLNFAVNHIDNIIDDYQIDDIIEQYRNQDPKEIFDIKGHSWKASDNSMLYLNYDETYTWYLNDQEREDNYYVGSFKSYNGKEAIQYIATYLKEFGITEEEQEKLFEGGANHLNNYYVLVLTCEKSKIDGKEQDRVDTKVYYYGFYSKTNNKLELKDINTKKRIDFTLNQKINDIDI